MDEGEVRSRSRSGTLWSLAGQGVGFVLVLAGEAARGRLLSRAEVGTFAAALVVTGLVAYLGEFGLGAEIVRRRDLTDAQLTAAHRAMVAASWALGVLAFLAAPVLGWWYQDPSVVPVARVLAFAFVLQGPGLTSRALLTRDLAFKRVVGADLAASAASVGLLIALGLSGAGVWALVAGLLASFAVRTVFVRVAHPWRPTRADWSVFRELLTEGARITGSRVLYYLQENVDRLALGRTSSSATLGLYDRAVVLATLPASRLTAVFNQVAYPAFAALVSDPPALRRQYLSTLRDITLLATPTAIGLGVVAREAVLVVYGPEWVDATPVVQAVCVVALARSVKVVAPAVFIARGQARFNLWISGVSVVVHTAAFAVGAAWGLPGMAVAFLVAVVPLNLAVTALASRAVGVGLVDLARATGPSTLRALAMGAAVWGTLLAVPPETLGLDEAAAAWARLPLGVAVGVVVYGALTWLTDPAARGFVQARLRRGQRGG